MRHVETLLGSLMEAVEAPDSSGASADLRVSNADQALPSAFPVTDLAVASIANAAFAARRIGELVGLPGRSPIDIDARAGSLWFGFTIEPQGWELPPVWDSVAGIYACGDRYVRLHTNAPHHKAAALRVLEADENRESVAAAVSTWDPFALETAVVEAGGVASTLRSRDEWVGHAQGAALASEPLVHVERRAASNRAASNVDTAGSPNRPLAGVRVLDLTRVLAGPVATRLLAGLGADVLRIDPPVWNEAGVAAEVNLGKRCARLDLRDDGDRAVFEDRLAEADIVVHGYRRDALSGLGYDEAARQRINPNLVDVSLNAWGHTGPWRDRRGFDSIVQIAAGVAHRGMEAYGSDGPTPLPVQALDHATGYTLAACALQGWAERLASGAASTWKTSLAAHAELLWPVADDVDLHSDFAALGDGDLAPGLESTSWGPVRRARAPMSIAGIDLAWPNGSADHGTSTATWSAPL